MGDWRIELRSRGTIGDTFYNNGKLQHLYLTLINNKGAAVAEIHGAQTDGDLQIKGSFPFVRKSSKLSYYFFGGDSPYLDKDSPYLDSSQKHWRLVNTLASGSEKDIRKAWGIAKEEARAIKEKKLTYDPIPENTNNPYDANSNSFIKTVIQKLQDKVPKLNIKTPNLDPRTHPGYNVKIGLNKINLTNLTSSRLYGNSLLKL